MRADEGYSCPTCGTREQVRDSRVDHRSLHVSVGPRAVLPDHQIGSCCPCGGNVLANAPVFGRSRPWFVARWRSHVNCLPLMSKVIIPLVMEPS
jgi:hypothetical protein